MISTSIKLDGEQEFKRQLSTVNGELKNLNSDMKLVTEQFKGQANTLEALTEKDRILNQQVEQQTEKVRALEEALDQAAEAYDENDKRVDNYHRSLNEARTQLIRMQRELQDNSKYLDEARHSADRAATSIDEFGREVEQVEGQSSGFGSALGGIITDLGKLKGAIAGGAAVVAIKEVGGAILDLEESTREYRQIMNSLETSGEAAGIAAEDTAERYRLLQGVVGDTQAAAEATAQLQTLEATEEQLDEATIGVIGSWSKLGGAAPIETIAESISQTVAASQATGAFADILMATGQSEDEFNEKLAATASASERLDLVLQTLAATGMTDLGEAYLANNEAAIKSNQSQDRLNAAYAALGETIAPVADLIRNGLATAVEFASEKVDIAIESVISLKSWWDKTADSIESIRSGGWSGVVNTLTSTQGLQTKAASVTAGLTGTEYSEKYKIDKTTTARTSTAGMTGSELRERGITVYSTVELDGRVAGESVTKYQTQKERAGGR